MMIDPETPLVSYVIATHNRRDDLEDAVKSILEQDYNNIEIIIISQSDDGTRSLFVDGPYDNEQISFFHFEEQLGAPEAKNRGLKKASGDILINIDDDAKLIDRTTTQKVVDEFDKDPQRGLIAFWGETPEGETPQPWIPYRKDVPMDVEFETTFFVGFGYAVRSQALKEAGYYPAEFNYGLEELDLAIRILDSDYKIKYQPEIKIQHKHTGTNEKIFSEDQVNKNYLKNRIRIAIRLLPWRYALTTTVVWSMYWLYQTGYDVKLVVESLKEIFESRDTLLENRSVISRDTIHYIKSKNGHLVGWLLV